MGNLANLDTTDDTPGDIRGVGKSLVAWYDAADEEDQATLREWVEAGLPARVIAERLTRAGSPMGQQTVQYGRQLLRRHRWAH